jgi:AcrR family transcriptional regulator
MKRADAKHRLGPFRDPDVDARVLSTTRRLLAERGYRRTSIDAIAEESGVSRPTIYRRWPSKAHVVYDTLYPPSTDGEPAAPPFTDINGAIHGIVEFIGGPAAREGLPGLIAEMRADPTLQPEFAQLYTSRVSGVLRELMANNPDSLRQVDADILLDAISGAAIRALCVRGVSDLGTFADTLADLLMNGLRVRDSQ